MGNCNDTCANGKPEATDINAGSKDAGYMVKNKTNNDNIDDLFESKVIDNKAYPAPAKEVEKDSQGRGAEGKSSQLTGSVFDDTAKAKEAPKKLVENKSVNGGLYTGEVLEDQPHGKGTFVKGNWTYIGSFQAGIMHGNGEIAE